MAEAQTKTLGLELVCASASATLRVPRTRLSRIDFFFASVQRPTMLSPAKWITASKPDTSEGARGAFGFHETCAAVVVAPRTRRTTSNCWAAREGSNAAPIGP